MHMLIGGGYKKMLIVTPQIQRMVAQSYSTAVVTLKMDEDGKLPYKPYHDVYVFNKRSGNPVRVPALSDQGNDITLFTEDWAPKLGYDLQTDGTPLGVTGVGGSMPKHFVLVQGIMQIDSALRPVRTTFAFGDTPKNLLGRESILGKYNVLYTPNTVHYTETSSGFDTRSESMHTYARNRGRINSGRNFGANWRNRT
jgi:hypothetical protein